MSEAFIQAKYDQLAVIAGKFGQQAQATADLRSRLLRSMQPLQAGGWQGQGATAFFAEMNGVVLPAMQRMIRVLEEARRVTLKISEIMRQAEEEASAVFRGQAVAAGSNGSPLANAVGGSGADGLSGSFGAGTTNPVSEVLGGVGGSPLSSWLTAPFAAGVSVFGPTPVPVLGPWGRVPTGYTNAGERLWLYIGGSGPDTIFSVHPYAGAGRAPFKLPKPNLRLDYGPIKTKLGQGFLPNGTGVPVPADPNFFHWNVEGGMGQINKPIFQTFGEAIAKDHQLLTSNPVPRPNVLGPIPGGRLVRGASKGLSVIGAGLDVYNIATADDKVKEASKVAGGWAGAWAVGKGLAAFGAGIGIPFGPIGGFVGGIGGGFVGGFVGYMGGSALGETIHDLF